jgi:hypothetical protein
MSAPESISLDKQTVTLRLKPRPSQQLVDTDEKVHRFIAKSATWRAAMSIAITSPVQPTFGQYNELLATMTRLFLSHECVGICVPHFVEQTAQKCPFRYKSRRDLVEWVIDEHNLVNIRLHKPILSYNEALLEYFAPLPVPENLWTRVAPEQLPAVKPHLVYPSNQLVEISIDTSDKQQLTPSLWETYHHPNTSTAATTK